jgi:hypothetical protein
VSVHSSESEEGVEKREHALFADRSLGKLRKSLLHKQLALGVRLKTAADLSGAVLLPPRCASA